MIRATTTTYRKDYRIEQNIFTTLVTGILLIIFVYIFFLQKAIINVVQREKLSQEVSSVQIDVGDLEQKYFSLKNSITLDLAHSKGLKNAEVTAYISKKTLTAMASKNEF